MLQDLAEAESCQVESRVKASLFDTLKYEKNSSVMQSEEVGFISMFCTTTL